MVMRYFRVNVEPRGQGRPRFRTVPVTQNGKRREMGVAYKAREDKQYEQTVKDAYNSTYGGIKPLNGYLEVTIHAWFPIPVSTSRKQRAEMLAGYTLPDKKPDIDNIAKAILDGLNGLAWNDDKQIVYLNIKKLYEQASHPVGVDVFIRELDLEVRRDV